MDFIVEIRNGRQWEIWAVCPSLAVAERCKGMLEQEGERARIKRVRRKGGDE